MPELDDKPDIEDESASPTVIDQTPDAPKVPAKRKRSGLFFGLIAVVSLLLIGGGIWLAPLVQEKYPGLLPAVASPPPDPLVAKTASLVERLETRIAELENRPAPITQAGEADMAALGARIEALESSPVPTAAEGPSNELIKNFIARLDALERQLEEIDGNVSAQEKASNAALEGLREDHARLNKRVARLQETPKAGGDFVGAAFFVAIGELRRQIDRGDPYRREFARLEALTRQGRAVDPVTSSYLSILSKHADSGVATLALLQQSYGAVADAVIEGDAPTDAGIWQRAWQSMASVVKVRRVGEVEGDTAEAIVSRAQARLGEGNVAGAVEEMAGLSQPSDSAASWIEAAVAHLQTREALSALEQRGFWSEAPS